MSKFVASNGYRVYADAGGLEVTRVGGAVRHTLGSYSVTALREFFQHERDQELGRWRCPENPDYVVYPFGDGAVEVLHEPGPTKGYYYPDEPERFDSNKGRVARAYFEARPKPWHDAKEGELWDITFEDCRSNALAVTNEYGDIEFVVGATRRMGVEYERITAGRRIWPEES